MVTPVAALAYPSGQVDGEAYDRVSALVCDAVSPQPMKRSPALSCPMAPLPERACARGIDIAGPAAQQSCARTPTPMPV